MSSEGSRGVSEEDGSEHEPDGSEARALAEQSIVDAAFVQRAAMRYAEDPAFRTRLRMADAAARSTGPRRYERPPSSPYGSVRTCRGAVTLTLFMSIIFMTVMLFGVLGSRVSYYRVKDLVAGIDPAAPESLSARFIAPYVTGAYTVLGIGVAAFCVSFVMFAIGDSPRFLRAVRCTWDHWHDVAEILFALVLPLFLVVLVLVRNMVPGL
jgi:hypothetical protein